MRPAEPTCAPLRFRPVAVQPWQARPALKRASARRREPPPTLALATRLPRTPDSMFDPPRRTGRACHQPVPKPPLLQSARSCRMRIQKALGQGSSSHRTDDRPGLPARAGTGSPADSCGVRSAGSSRLVRPRRRFQTTADNLGIRRIACRHSHQGTTDMIANRANPKSAPVNRAAIQSPMMAILPADRTFGKFPECTPIVEQASSLPATRDAPAMRIRPVKHLEQRRVGGRETAPQRREVDPILAIPSPLFPGPPSLRSVHPWPPTVRSGDFFCFRPQRAFATLGRIV